MVTRSIDNYEQHKKDIYKVISEKYGEKRAKEFIDFYSSRYDKFGRSFLDYRVCWSLFDDYKLVAKSGIRWYACVGSGGTGKTTLAKNIGHFLDNTFDVNRVKITAYELVKKLNEFDAINAMKAIILDEPDESVHPTSKQGRKLRNVLGKARQQQIFVIYCATDMRDIPDYMYKKLSGIFFCSQLGHALFFKDKPRSRVYIINQIKRKYKDDGYGVFFNFKRNKGCLSFSTTKQVTLSEEDEKEYIKYKSNDYKKELKSCIITMKEHKKKDEGIPIEHKIILNAYKKGLTQQKIGEIIGKTRERVNQIIGSYKNKSNVT